jgi:N12 class adenine-specific DNA methylase
MSNPFDDLIPAGSQDTGGNSDPFADLVPSSEQPFSFDSGNAFSDLSPQPSVGRGVHVRDDGIKAGEMSAVEPSFLEERIINPLRSGYYRGKQGMTLMLSEMGFTDDDPIRMGVRMTEHQRMSDRFAPSYEDQDATRRVSEADTFGGVMSELWDNPQVISNITLESLGLMAPGLAATAGLSVMGGPLATALAAGSTSGGTEYAQTISSVMQEHGVNPNDPMSWAKALANPELMSEARESGAKRGISVAAFDALTAGLAGKIMAGAKGGIVSPTLRAGGELGMQSLGGAAGETTAQIADKGQVDSLGEIVLEGMAEGPTAIVEAPGNIAHHRARQRQTVDTVKSIAENLAFDQVPDDQLNTLVQEADRLNVQGDPELTSALDALKAEQSLRTEEPARGVAPPIPAEQVIGTPEGETPTATPVQMMEPDSLLHLLDDEFINQQNQADADRRSEIEAGQGVKARQAEIDQLMPGDTSSMTATADNPFADLVPESEAATSQVPEIELPVVEKDGPLFNIKGEDDNIDLTLLEEREAEIQHRYPDMTPEEQGQADATLSGIAEIRGRVNSSRPVAEPAKLTRSEKARNSYAKAKQIDSQADRLSVAIAKLGGLSKAEAEASGFDAADMGRHGWRIMRTFNNGQKADTLDGMRERLNGEGFYFETVNDMINALHDDMAGNQVMTAAGFEAGMEAKALDRMEQLEAMDEDAPPVDEFTGDMYLEPADKAEPSAYDPSWSEEARTMMELYTEADQLDSAAAEAIFESGQDDSVVALKLYDLIRDNRNATNNRPGTPADQGEGQKEPAIRGVSKEKAAEPEPEAKAEPGGLAPGVKTESTETPPSSGVSTSRDVEPKPSLAEEAKAVQSRFDAAHDRADKIGGDAVEDARRRFEDGEGEIEDFESALNAAEADSFTLDGAANDNADLLGDDTSAAQEAADLSREKDEKRSPAGVEPALVQSGNDLFADGGRLEPDLFAGNDIDQAASDAAHSTENDLPEPTQAQKEAGNYKKGHTKLHGLDISIENPKGSTRSGTDPAGKEWSQEMQHHYGYIRSVSPSSSDKSVSKSRIATTNILGDTAEAFPGSKHRVDLIPVVSELASRIRDADSSITKNFSDNGRIDTKSSTNLFAANAFRKEVQSLINIPPGVPDASIKAAFNKAVSDGLSADAHLFGNFRNAHSIRSKGYDLLGIKRQAVVKRHMLSAIKDSEVFGAIVNLIPIDMVNMLTTSELSAKDLLSNQPMFLNRLSVAFNDPVKIGGIIDAIAASHPAALALRVAEEINSGGYSAGAAIKLGPAEGTINNRHKKPSKKAKSYYSTKGKDKDHVDVFLTDNAENAGTVFVIDQVDPKTRKFDEHKVVIGPNTEEEAHAAYQANYEEGWAGADSITEMDIEEFKAWVKDPAKTKRRAGIKKSKAVTQSKTSQANPKPTTKSVEIGSKSVDKPAVQNVASDFKPTHELADGTPVVALEDEPGVWLDAEGMEIEDDSATPIEIEGGERDLPKDVRAWAENEAWEKKHPDYRSTEDSRAHPSILHLNPKTGGTESWPMSAFSDQELLEELGITALEAEKSARIKQRDQKTEETHEPKQLDQSGQGALEGVSTDQVPGTTEGRETGRGTDGSSRADAPGNEPAGEPGLSESRGLGNDEGEVSVSTAGTESGRNRSQSGGQPVSRGDSSPESTAAGQPRAVTPAKDRAVNFTISADLQIGSGGAKTKFKGNVAAITLLKQLQAENRQATRDEQAVLAKYVGWGGIPQAFYKDGDVTTSGWDKEAAELKSILTTEEYDAARRSTQDAHYTSTEIVSSIWDAVQQFGFHGGKVLEPSVGVGNFFGLMPGDLRAKSGLTGVELDHITGGIAKQLYPGAHILDATGFQDFTAPDGTYDLAIGNPPFGSQKLYDGKRKHLSKFSIHNYFFGKSIDLLKPNGVLAMVVSNSMMDAYGDRARQYISDRTEFLGAIRLPNNAFLKNAGTEVTTDIIFLRKLADGGDPRGESWMDVQEIKDPDGKDNIPLNEYFVRHPENMLGRMERSGSMYRADAPALVAEENQDTAKLLSEAVGRMRSNFMDEPGRAPVTERVEVARDVEDVRVGSMFVKDGEIYIRTEDVENVPKADKVEITRKYKGKLIPDKKATERVRGMIFVRDALARLRKSQMDEAITRGKLKIDRAALNRAYDNFVKKHGPINQDANKRVFRDDPTWPQIAALEDSFDKGVSAAVAKRTGEKPRKPSAKKAAIFTKRTQSPYKPVESVSSAKDALVATLSEKGRVDIDYMAGIYDRSSGQIISELQGLILNNPVGGWETREEYLSGNVKTKLAVAEEAAKTNPDYQENVDALKAVQPADIEAVDIDVKIGAHWLPQQVMADFVDHITGGNGGTAVYSAFNAKWQFDSNRASADKATQWGTDRKRPVDLLTDISNQKATVVHDRTIDKKTVVNEEATNAAQEKAGLIKDEWRRWLWQDDTRRAELAKIYNDSFNTDVVREFDGSHLAFPGQVSDDIIKLRPHQANAVWRIIQSDTTLLDHVVGAGKTFTVIASVMEMRRLGLSKKPVIAVPNHLVGQWAEDFIQLYPGANILAATKRDFEKSNRKKLFARISTGDWDAVIVAHSSFGKVEVDPEYQERFIKEQIKDLDTALTALKEADGGKSRSVKDAEKQKERLQEKLEKLFDAENKDDSLYFGELGIDALFLDEAHEFKNLAFATSMTRVAGLGNPQGSQKASDMFMKIQYTLDKTGGRNVVFATGTPISNTMAEMYTMQRYLSYGTLKVKGLAHFDAWSRQYGEVVTDWELSPSGTYKLNSRFAKFVNMPELMQDYLSAADVINRDDINEMLAKQGKRLPVPKIKGGKPQNVVVERSDSQAVYIGEPIKDEHGNDTDKYPEGTLVWRAENLPKGPPKKGDDNMLKIMSDARKAALDMRMISPGYGDNEQSKINYAAGEILRMYQAWNKHRGAQLVFIDLSTPKNNRAKEAAEIRALIEKAEAGDQAAEAQLDKLSPDQLSALDGGEFSVYDDLRQKLINLGIPDNEIAYIHQANTELQKEELFGKVRSGRIRVLLGSTAKMGAGMNVQERLVALHHMDAPWRPSDLEQREGRIIRQGNALYDLDPDGFEIEILRYATKQTLDSRMWQTIEGKARFIEQVRKGNMLAREVEDVAGEAANAAEMKAASSGNPMILEEMELRTTIRKLEGLQYAHDKQQFRIHDSIKHNQNVIALQEKTQANLEKDIQTRDQKGSKEFSIKVEGKTYTKRKDGGARLLLSAAALAKSGKPFKKVGVYSGFTITLDNLEQRGFVVSLIGAGEYQIDVKDIAQADPTGLSTRIANITKGFESQMEQSKAWQEEAETVIPGLKEQLGTWEKAGELDAAKKRHADVIKELRPKKQAQAAKDEGAGPDNPRLSRSDSRPAAIYGMPRDEVVAAIASTTKSWAQKPRIVVVDNIDDPRIPRSLLDETSRQDTQGASGKPLGYLHNKTGTIYLVAENLKSPEQAIKVLLHEALGHLGLRGVFGTDLVKVLNQIANTRPKELQAKAKKYGLDLNKKNDRLLAAEELLAEMAEAKPELGHVRRAVAAIRTWLRKNIPYFRKLEVSDDEIIRQYIIPARRLIEQGRTTEPRRGYTDLYETGNEKDQREGGDSVRWADGRGEAAAEAPVPEPLSRGVQDEGPRGGKGDDRSSSAGTGRAKGGSLTDNTGFSDWFADSKVVDADGNPRILYRGESDSNYTVFDRSSQGSHTKSAGSGYGFFFGPTRRVAEGYGDTVREFYLSIQNPYVLPEIEMLQVRTIEEARLVADWIEAQGYDGIYIPEEDTYIAFHSEQIKLADNETFTRGDPDVRLSRSKEESEDPSSKVAESASKGAPLDKIFRLPFNVIGSVDSHGDWHPPRNVKNFGRAAVARLNGAADVIAEHAPWTAHLVNEAKAGLIDRYGLDDHYKARDAEREADERRLAMQGVEIIQDLGRRGVDQAEAKVLQSILNGETIPDAEWSEIAEPVRRAIDDMGQEAVNLGLISNESYERNKGTYLHRVYMKHEDSGSLGGWASKIIGKRRKKIIGNTMKGRGMNLKVTTERVLKAVPEAWFGRKLKKGAADKQLKGHSFIVFDRMAHTGEGTQTAPGIEEGGRKPRILERVYWPAEKPVPAKYEAWDNKGTWEVRSIQGDKVVLWRDFTKDERQSMGEILDARYTIAKTFQQMSHDLANGRFLKDIASNDTWTWTGEGEPENAIAAKEGTYRAYGNHEWVLVPNSAIPGTGGKKRWGALSGRYVRAEIWRDLNELDRMSVPGVWRKILTQWKLNKTARNPVVHMNNVMSNLLFMDMAGVRMRDLAQAVQIMAENGQEYQEAMTHGAFGGSFVNQEIQQNVLQPILDELKKQNMSDQGTMEQRIGWLGKFLDTIWKHGKSADKWMIEKYQMEDEVFRMATYLRRRALGDSTEVAATTAREQFLNYDIRAPWINALRNTVLPFISYTYRAVPVIAESMAKRPWKLAKYATVAYAMNALAYALSDGDEDRERRSLREQEQGNTWLPGVPRLMRMPWMDANDSPVFLDIRRWIPAGDVFDTNQGQGTGIPAPLQMGGPLMLAGEFMLNKTAFTGREIWDNKTDEGMRKAKKVADWAWKSWMPSAPWIYNSWYWDKISRSLSGGRDYAGRAYEPSYAITSSVGIKLKPHDVNLGFERKERDFKAIERALEFDMKMLQRDRSRNLIDKETYKEEVEAIREQALRLQKKARETFTKSK